MKYKKPIPRHKKRKITEAVLSLLFLLTAVLFLILYFRSKTYELVNFATTQFQNIIYNDHYADAYYFCLNASIASAAVLIVDSAFSKIKMLIQQNKTAS